MGTFHLVTNRSCAEFYFINEVPQNIMRRKWSMLEWYRQGKTKVLGEKSVPVPLCPPQISHIHLVSNPGLLDEKETNRLKPWARPLDDRIECTSHSVRPSQRTAYASITTTDRWMLCTQTTAVYWKDHTKHIDTVWAKCRIFRVKPDGTLVGYHCALVGSRVKRYYVVPFLVKRLWMDHRLQRRRITY